MIFEKERSLGLLPVWVSVFFAVGLMVMLSLGIVMISRRNPVAFVNGATRPAATAPFVCAERDVRGIATIVAENWYNWTEATFTSRRTVALEYTAPGLRPRLQAEISQRQQVVEATAMTSTGVIERIDIFAGPPNSHLWQADALMQVDTTYAGIGAPDPEYVKLRMILVESRPVPGAASVVLVGQISELTDDEVKGRALAHVRRQAKSDTTGQAIEFRVSDTPHPNTYRDLYIAPTIGDEDTRSWSPAPR